MTDRPHKVLGQQRPDRLYAASPRRLPRGLSPLEYPGHYERGRVAAPGVMWHSRPTVGSTVLIGETIGLEPIDDGEWDLHFGPIRLGRFDERTRRIAPGGTTAVNRTGVWKLPEWWTHRTRPHSLEKAKSACPTAPTRKGFGMIENKKLLPMSPDRSVT